MYGSAPPRYGPPQGQDRFAAQAPPQRPLQRPPVRPPEPVDFLVGMVVRLTGGAKAGRLAVLTEPADQRGYAVCCFRDGHGRLSREMFQVATKDIALADPPKNGFVVVLKGQYHSRTGIVKAAAGHDALVSFQRGDETVVKRSTLAWLHEAA